MPSLQTKGEKDTVAGPNPLSNVQMELLKLYSTDIKEKDLEELKKVLANYFAQKAIKEAGKIWDQKKMSADTMEKWLNEE